MNPLTVEHSTDALAVLFEQRLRSGGLQRADILEALMGA